MDHISKAFQFLNTHVLPAHQPASFGYPLKLDKPNSGDKPISESAKITAQNQRQARENSASEATRSRKVEDKKLSSHNAHLEKQKKVGKLQQESQPKSNDSSLKQQPQKLLTPKPKI